MKIIIFLAAFAGGFYLFGPGQDMFGGGGGNSEAVVTYKKFMDKWIVGEYDLAETYAAGNAADKVRSAQGDAKVFSMKGTVEGSRVKVVSETESGGKLKLELLYSASISWPGSTANPMSPGSW